MSQTSKSKTNKKQQQIFGLRSVGGRPCDFHKLKYTTSYRVFGKKSLPHFDLNYQQPNQQLANFDLKLSMSKQKEKQQKVTSTKKIIPIDKWKQRYNKAQQNYYSVKKSQEYFPMISSRNTFYPKQKPVQREPKIQKIMHKKQKQISQKNYLANLLSIPIIVQRQSRILDHVEEDVVFQKYEVNKKQIGQNIQQMHVHKTKSQAILPKKTKFTLDVDKKINEIFKIKRRSNTNLMSLKEVDQRPQRWEVMQQQQWSQQNNEKYQSNSIAI